MGRAAAGAGGEIVRGSLDRVGIRTPVGLVAAGELLQPRADTPGGKIVSMAHEGTFEFTITGTLKTDSTSVRTALIPVVEQLLQDRLQQQGLVPNDDGVAVALSSDVLSDAMSGMDAETPEGLVRALLEGTVPRELADRLPSSEVVGLTVMVERSE